MLSEVEDPDRSSGNDTDGELNHRECPHCGLMFRMDEAKSAGPDAVRCPNCGWVLQRV
ncbi:MAG: hypothetical protein HQL17_01235 [Candidatus Omnitrophica bacterium]|nr:hypothetical protein [Candidatus Omnitrophota bacterium]